MNIQWCINFRLAKQKCHEISFHSAYRLVDSYEKNITVPTKWEWSNERKMAKRNTSDWDQRIRTTTNQLLRTSFTTKNHPHFVPKIADWGQLEREGENVILRHQEMMDVNRCVAEEDMTSGQCLLPNHVTANSYGAVVYGARNVLKLKRYILVGKSWFDIGLSKRMHVILMLDITSSSHKEDIHCSCGA